MKQNPTVRWMTARGLMIVPAVTCSAPIVEPIGKAIDEGTLIHEGEYSTGNAFTRFAVLRRTCDAPLAAIIEDAAQRGFRRAARSRMIQELLRREFRRTPTLRVRSRARI